METVQRVDSAGVLPGIQSLWEDELLSDYTIEVEDKEFRVHKLLLASVSDYFRVMLTGGMKESQTDRVRLQGLDSLAVSNMIEYIYTGQFGTKRASTEELLSCAVYLQMPATLTDCSETLYKSVNITNCFDILSTFKTHANKYYVNQTRKYIRSNLDEILKNCEPNKMSYEGFINLMDFWQKSELDNYQSAIKWFCSDIVNRQQYLNSLMSQIHFAVLTPDELAKVKRTWTFANSKGSWRELVDEAIKYHKLPGHLKVHKSSEQNRVRGEPAPICITLADDNSPSEVYAVKDGKSWTRVECSAPYLPKGIESYGFDKMTTAYINNFVILMTEFDQNQSWHIFDPRTFKWSPMAALRRPKFSVGLATHGNKLYALGGRVGPTALVMEPILEQVLTDEIEEYDFETDTWRILPYKMPYPVHCHRTVEHGGLIYVFGGLKPGEQREDYVGTLLSFNPSTGSWKTKATMPKPPWNRIHMHVVTMDSVDCIFVIIDALQTFRYDLSEDTWSEWKFEWQTDYPDLCLYSGLECEGNTFYFLSCGLLRSALEMHPMHRLMFPNQLYPTQNVTAIVGGNKTDFSGPQLDPYPVGRTASCYAEKESFCVLLTCLP